jgi:hypothetical protein
MASCAVRNCTVRVVSDDSFFREIHGRPWENFRGPIYGPAFPIGTGGRGRRQDSWHSDADVGGGEARRWDRASGRRGKRKRCAYYVAGVLQYVRDNYGSIGERLARSTIKVVHVT